MTNETTDRGFQRITHEKYPPRGADEAERVRVVQQSSAVGNYPDACDRPGSSYLWVGSDLHLNRAEVAQLWDALWRWMTTGDLFERKEEAT